MSSLLQRLCSLSECVNERCFIVAAHPDDEILGTGTRLRKLRDPVFLYMTDGAPRDPRYFLEKGCSSRSQYADLRRAESEQALRIAGLDVDRCIWIGTADQETSFHMSELIMKMRALINDLKPALIITHSYEGGHPDHDTASLVVAAASKTSALNPSPVIMEFTSYYLSDGKMVTNSFLRPELTPCLASEIGVDQLEMKKRMLASFYSQKEMISRFDPSVELFRIAPIYYYSRTPHPGTLFYECFDWGMTGAEWRVLAIKTLEELGMKECLWL